MPRIYLDNNATTPVHPDVIEAMLPFYRNSFGNPSCIHWAGKAVKGALEKARMQVASLVNCTPAEVVFTSGGSESINTAIKGAAAARRTRGNHIISTRVEHSAVFNCCRYLEKEGFRVTYLEVDAEGMLDLNALAAAITDQTILIAAMYANNETGVIFPIEKIGEIVKEKGIPFHTDAVQTIGKIPVNLKKSAIDMLSLSGHKLHSPKGIGVLYIRKGTKFSPFLIGGHQEKGRRGGTENVPYIIGLGKACELAKKHMEDENTRVKALRDYLEQKILEKIPSTLVNGDPVHRLPNTVSVSFEYVEGESILLLLSDLGICASSGSACTSGSLEPSHVLRAMGVPFTAAHGSIRFSLSIYNTKEEMDYIIEHLPPIIQRLRDISPFWHDYLKSQGKKSS